MKIRRLYLGDMGIYRNSLMDNISPKIVVIGGFNRSGKTTLLETLRHLPYGFPKGLRKTAFEYSVEGDFINNQGDKFIIKVNGLGEPQVSSFKGKGEFTAKDIYGKVDNFTYKQLFTITLDELKKSEVKSEEEKIQSVLLGAGLKSIVEIPKIIDEFKKEKEKIGGKYGNPTTKQLKVPYDNIIDGIKLRDNALLQIQEYNNKCSQLSSVEKEIKASEEDINSIQNKIIVIELLKAGYSQYKNKKELQLELAKYTEPFDASLSGIPSQDRIEAFREEYANLYNNYKELLNNFKRNFSRDEVIQDKLIEFREDIKGFSKQISGLKQKLSSCLASKAQYDIDKGEILKRMNLLNQNWKGDMLKILKINCDSIEQDKLAHLVEEANAVEEKDKKYQYELENLDSQKDIIKKEIRGLKTKDAGILIKNYLYISLGIIFAGILLYFKSKALGSSLSVIGVVTASLYFFLRNISQNQLLSRKTDLEFQLASIENRIDENTRRFDSDESIREELYHKLQTYKEKLGLVEDISNSALLQYFKDVQDLKSRIINLGYQGKMLEATEEELKKELGRVKTLVFMFYQEKPDEDDNTLGNSEELFIKMGLLEVQLEAAEELNSAKIKLNDVNDKIKKQLQINCTLDDMLYELDNLLEKYKTYSYYNDLKAKIQQLDLQIRQGLAAYRTVEALNEILQQNAVKVDSETQGFETLCDLYGSLEQIDREYIFAKKDLTDLINRLDALKDQRQDLRSDINMLQTTEKIEKAQRMIDAGRESIRPLAAKFAVLSAAEYILDNVQKKFIENAKNTVLGDASSVLCRITNGEYKNILPQDNILQSDFKTVINDGEVQDSVNYLSRGTGEQLFLSVRLSRIKEIEPKLPVILDDPFVNFDSIHTRNVLEIISELGEENQIFMLTCHPELIELMQAVNSDVQFWKLDKGKFELSTGSDLIKYLSKK